MHAAARAFEAQWYDDVTLRGVAEQAGVALQTVLNHFPAKEQLYAAAAARTADEIAAARWAVEPADVAGALDVLVEDYERTGDATLRTLAVEGRLPIVAPTLAQGRAGHEKWCAHVFGHALTGLSAEQQQRRLAQLVVATDVYTWKLLRRDRRLTRDQTREVMRELVDAVIEIEGD